MTSLPIGLVSLDADITAHGQSQDQERGRIGYRSPITASMASPRWSPIWAANELALEVRDGSQQSWKATPGAVNGSWRGRAG